MKNGDFRPIGPIVCFISETIQDEANYETGKAPSSSVSIAL